MNAAYTADLTFQTLRANPEVTKRLAEIEKLIEEAAQNGEERFLIEGPLTPVDYKAICLLKSIGYRCQLDHESTTKEWCWVDWCF